MMARYDVVTLGETMVRLTPPNLRRLEQTTSLDVEVGGTESNLAIGLARLGLKSLWLSRLTANPLGRLIANALAAHGVDTSRIVWTDEDRVGVLFYEISKRPRASRVLYDRRHSAVSRMQPSDLPADLFQPDGARVFHTTGITLALTPELTRTAHHALHLATSAGWLISFDMNYRSSLWSPAEAREGCDTYASAADLFFIPHGDACQIYDLDPTMRADAILGALASRYPQATLILTLGAEGAMASEPGGQVVHQSAFAAVEVERLGGGDAFAAGFLYAYLSALDQPDRLAQALRWGAASAALKYTIPGDAPLIDREEVEALLRQDGPSTSLQR
jgi:2-dehydro-3-deoxygluconokinase